MIEKLKKKDLKEASKVYNRGLKMEIPPGYRYSLEKSIAKLEKMSTFVFKDKHKIKGLVAFNIFKKNIKINFICSMQKRKGIGKSLILNLARYGLRNKIELIYSTVSSLDKRVINFYDYCGFKRYNKFKASQDFILYGVKAKPRWIIDKMKSE